MSTIDIVARLQLRAEQFSSENGAAFAEMRTRARTAAQDVRESFSGSFAEVNKLAQTALVLPRNAGGSLDLSGEIRALNASAAAADQRAIALRELSVAQSQAAQTAGVDAEAMRLEADAAAVASLAEERKADTDRKRVIALQAVNTALSQSRSATAVEVEGLDEVTHASGRTSIAKMEMQHVIRASSDALAAGAPISQIFAQEIGRVGEAASFAGGKLGKVGEFLAGPWGLAFTVGLAVVTPFVAKLLEGNSALDDAVEKLKKDALETATTAEAQKKFADSAEGVADAIHKQNEALEKNLVSQTTATDQALADARVRKDQEIQIRKTTIALLEQAQAEARQANNASFGAGGGAGAGMAQAVYAQRVEDYQAALKKAQNDLSDAQAAIRNAEIHVGQQEAKAAVDPLVKINQQYDRMADKAIAAAKGNDKLASSITGTLTAIEKRRAAALKEVQDERRDERKKPPSLGSQLETEQGQRLLTSASSYRGLDENRDNGALRSLFSKANENVDPKMVAWCAAFVNAVLGVNGLPGTGSLSARSFLGYGSATEKPEKGDIVVARRGTGNQGHVGFYEGTDAKGNIRVLGGNTGNKVATETVKRSDVLGFRRAPTAAESYKAEEEAAKKLAEVQRQSSDEIARINAQWDEQPRLIDKARLETSRLNEIIADLQKQKPSPAINEQIAAAQRAKAAIDEGLTRPFTDYVKSQREGLAINQLQLQGREAEAGALSDALRLQQQMGPLDQAQLATVLRIAQQQQKIADAIEDQRRVIGLYTGAVGDLEQSFDTFLSGLRDKPGEAIKGLVSGVVSSFEHLQNSLISEQLFGGLQRDIERYVAQQTGGTTPEDMLKQQLSVAGDALDGHVDRTGSALDRFVRSVDDVSEQLRGISRSGPISAAVTPQDLLSPNTLSDLQAQAIAEATRATPANDNAPDSAMLALASETDRNTRAVMSASDIYSKVGANFVTRLENMVGVKLPVGLEKTLKDGLGPLLQGASNGQLGGSVFSAITGGKNDPLASGIGGALGEKAGKALEKPLGDLFGKAIGGFAGPLGGVLGGVLGNVLGGLFNNPKFGTASISLNQFGEASGGTGTGNSGNAAVAATGLASSVASGINSVADQLGAKITNLAAVTVGNFDGKYRVATTNTSASLNYNNFNASTLKNFDSDQQAAIEYAIKYALSTSVINGISQASQNIIKAGSDLTVSIQKALLIESVPKDLKAALDPVGAAIDDLNRKWQKTVDALKEGGATTEQMTQAQQLYTLQLDQVKNSTDAADKTLKDFLSGLKLGSDSPYSLRDQEATARAQLQPFLDQINGGQSIDQSKYQEAAKSFLDVERQLYGSTQGYFNSLDQIQAATNKAISTIDNAVPITAAVESPFPEATAKSAAATAAAVVTGNEMAQDTNALLAQIATLMQQVAANTGGGTADPFIGTGRAFASAA